LVRLAADGDAEPIRQVVGDAGPDDDTLLQKPLLDLCRLRADLDQHKVGVTLEVPQSQPVKLAIQEQPPLVVGLHGLYQKFLVLQRGDTRDLGQQVDGKRFLDPVQRGENLGRTDRVPQADTGNAIDL